MSKTTTKKKRINPAVSPAYAEALQSLSGDMLVLARLADWTRDEKLILAAMLPDVRKMLRKVPAATLARMTAGPDVKVTVTGQAKVKK
ncbi:MAG: hypothetical protein IVW54_16730 [Candidatus Binataceae bacterium]|nr:hypothetical protein [Candidatus Binataceae bacterium]